MSSTTTKSEQGGSDGSQKLPSSSPQDQVMSDAVATSNTPLVPTGESVPTTNNTPNVQAPSSAQPAPPTTPAPHATSSSSSSSAHPRNDRGAEYTCVPSAQQTFQTEVQALSAAWVQWPIWDSAYSCPITHATRSSDPHAPEQPPPPNPLSTTSQLEYGLGLTQEHIATYEDGSYAVPPAPSHGPPRGRLYVSSAELAYATVSRGRGEGLCDGFVPFSSTMVPHLVPMPVARAHKAVMLDTRPYSADPAKRSEAKTNPVPPRRGPATTETETALVDLTAATTKAPFTVIETQPSWAACRQRGVRLGEPQYERGVSVSVFLRALEALGAPPARECAENVLLRVGDAILMSGGAVLKEELVSIAGVAKRIYEREKAAGKAVDAGERLFPPLQKDEAHVDVFPWLLAHTSADTVADTVARRSEAMSDALDGDSIAMGAAHASPMSDVSLLASQSLPLLSDDNGLHYFALGPTTVRVQPRAQPPSAPVSTGHDQFSVQPLRAYIPSAACTEVKAEAESIHKPAPGTSTNGDAEVKTEVAGGASDLYLMLGLKADTVQARQDFQRSHPDTPLPALSPTQPAFAPFTVVADSLSASRVADAIEAYSETVGNVITPTAATMPAELTDAAAATPAPVISADVLRRVARLPHVRASEVLTDPAKPATRKKPLNPPDCKRAVPLNVPLLNKVPYEPPLPSSANAEDLTGLGGALDGLRVRSKALAFSQGYTRDGRLRKRNYDEFLADLGLGTVDMDVGGERGPLETDARVNVSVDCLNKEVAVRPLGPGWRWGQLQQHIRGDPHRRMDVATYTGNSLELMSTAVYASRAAGSRVIGNQRGVTKHGNVLRTRSHAGLRQDWVRTQALEASKLLLQRNMRLPPQKRVYTSLERVAHAVVSCFLTHHRIYSGHHRDYKQRGFSTVVECATDRGGYDLNDGIAPAGAVGMGSGADGGLVGAIDGVADEHRQSVNALARSIRSVAQLLGMQPPRVNARKNTRGHLVVDIHNRRARKPAKPALPARPPVPPHRVTAVNNLKSGDVVCHTHPMLTHATPLPVMTDYGIPEKIEVPFPAALKPIRRNRAVDTSSILAQYFNDPSFTDRDNNPYRKRKHPISRLGNAADYYADRWRGADKRTVSHGLSEKHERYFGTGDEESRAGMFTRGALLNHWSRGVVPPTDPFRRFDRSLEDLVYTDDEYAVLLQDPAWTRAQTDRLVDLVHRYNGDFIVVHDRFCSMDRDTDLLQGPHRPVLDSKGQNVIVATEDGEGTAVEPCVPFPNSEGEDVAFGMGLSAALGPLLQHHDANAPTGLDFSMPGLAALRQQLSSLHSQSLSTAPAGVPAGPVPGLAALASVIPQGSAAQALANPVGSPVLKASSPIDLTGTVVKAQEDVMTDSPVAAAAQGSTATTTSTTTGVSSSPAASPPAGTGLQVDPNASSTASAIPSPSPRPTIPTLPLLPVEAVARRAQKNLPNAVDVELGSEVMDVLHRLGVDVDKHVPKQPASARSRARSSDMLASRSPSPSSSRSNLSDSLGLGLSLNTDIATGPEGTDDQAHSPACPYFGARSRSAFAARCHSRKQKLLTLSVPARPVLVVTMAAPPVIPSELHPEHKMCTVPQTARAGFALADVPEVKRGGFSMSALRRGAPSRRTAAEAEAVNDDSVTVAGMTPASESKGRKTHAEAADDGRRKRARNGSTAAEDAVVSLGAPPTHTPTDATATTTDATASTTSSVSTASSSRLLRAKQPRLALLPTIPGTPKQVGLQPAITGPAVLPSSLPMEMALSNPSVALQGAATAYLPPTVFHVGRDDGVLASHAEYSIAELGAHTDARPMPRYFITDRMGLGAVVASARDAVSAGEKTVEDLKARYYTIQQKLVMARHGATGNALANPTPSHDFPVEYEQKRKRLLAQVFRRRTDTLNAVVRAVLEVHSVARVLRGVCKQLKQHKQKQLALLAQTAEPVVDTHVPVAAARYPSHGMHALPGPGRADMGMGFPSMPPSLPDSSPIPSAGPYSAAMQQALPVLPKMAMHPIAPPPVALMALPPPLQASLASRLPLPFTVASDGTPLAPIPPQCIATDVLRKPGAGVFLRSQLIGTDVAAASRVGKKLETVLFDFNFKKPNPFTVPSRMTSRGYDALRNSIVTQMQLEKHLHKREQERNEKKQNVDLALFAAAQQFAQATVQRAVNEGAGHRG